MYIGSALMFSFYLVESFAREVITDEFIAAKFPLMHIFVPRTLYLGSSWSFILNLNSKFVFHIYNFTNNLSFP